ncbi:hypothetical protein CF335_g7273 [Tilletia laevis]|nr:hypothetical protein CF335_g7273 [Tilletia laevis]
MRVHGLGDVETLGWATITFFVPARDSHGFALMLEVELDFHVLPAFAPGLLLGLDFIQGHGVTIDAPRGQATVLRYAFDVAEHLPSPAAKEAALCCAESVCLPGRSMTWIPVDVAALSTAVDYTFHPRLMTDPDETIKVAGPAALGNRSTTHVLLGNYGTRPVHLDRRTPVVDAVAAQLGDVSAEPDVSHNFELGYAMPPAMVQAAATDPGAWTPSPATGDDVDDSVASPLDLFENVEEPAASLTRDAETVLVDDHFRVGVDASGAPHPDVVALLRRNEAAFALDGRPGLIKGEEMPITLQEGAQLRSEPPRRASPEKREAMDKAIEQLLDWEVIEPSTSPVSFPVLMVRQYNKWRFCVDYRNLNSVTVADRYPLPTTDAVFQTLQGKRWYSSLDAIRGYHQHPVREADRWKTAFVCHRGLYDLKGEFNASFYSRSCLTTCYAFYRYIRNNRNHAVFYKRYQYRTVPFGLRNAPAVFQRMMDRVLGELRWKTAVVYIDDVVAATATLEEHLETLEMILSRATTMGLKFSPSKCTFAVPSLTLLGRKVSGAGVAVWQDRAKAVLDLPAPTTLRDLYHVLGLFGYYRGFIPRYAERAEPLTRLTQGWRWESVGDRTRLVRKDGTVANADKERLEWADAQERSFVDLKNAIARPPVLAHPDPTRPYVLYVDASKDAFAAVLHQIFEDPVADTATAAFPLAPAALVSAERWLAWLRTDRFFGPILRRVESDDASDSEWIVDQGLLLRRVDGRLALPEAAAPLVFRSVHDDNGHFGYTKTCLAVMKNYWRPRLAEMVSVWVRHCAVCQRVKLSRRVGELDVDKDAQFPFETCSFDLVLGLPRSQSGNDAVLVMHDVFSRMVLLEPCKARIDAAGIAALISNRILRLGWRPRRLVSDSEARVTGRVMQALADSLKARLTPSPPHHQQANVVERAVQTVQHTLRALTEKGAAGWDRRVVPAVEVAMNSTPNVTTGYAPFDLVFLAHPGAAHAVIDAGNARPGESFEDRLLAANERLEDARRAIGVARAQQKRRYDASRGALPVLAVGDKVFVRLRDRPVAGFGQGKLDGRKLGPFRVGEVLSDHRVRLDLPESLGIGKEFAVDQLDIPPRSPDPFAASRDLPDIVPPLAIADDAAPGRALVDDQRPAAEPDARFDPDRGPGTAAGGLADDEVVENVDPMLRPRARGAPSALRDFVLCVQGAAVADTVVATAEAADVPMAVGIALAAAANGVGEAPVVVPTELLRGPLPAPKQVQIGGRSVMLRERPIAYQSRLTTPSEKRLVAPELELCCFAWAFARMAHLLEGAEITVVTDHLPMGAMLQSDAGARYGPTISRCRALVLPHLHSFRFVHRSGKSHINVDALSRLPVAP